MQKHGKIGDGVKNWHDKSLDRHEEFHRLHDEYHRQAKELFWQQRKLERDLRQAYGMNREASGEELRKMHEEFHRQQDELRKRFEDLRKSKLEFQRLNRHVRISPPIILALNIVIWYLIFRYAGIETFSILLAILVSLGGFFEFFFLRKLNSRILNPMQRLRAGVEEISKGNYDVKVQGVEHSEIGLLIDSFNEMASKLQQGEKVKAEYEVNRRNLIANISHDLKTPITSIQGYIEAITENEGLSRENLGRYLKIINTNASYMNKLIDDLFLFSKLDMQKLEFQFEKISVRPFVNDLMEEFKLDIEERNVRFDYKDSLEEYCSFSVDRKRLHQIFRNIISNALKYGPETGLSIRTELYRLEDFIGIDIRDNGPGISKEKIPHIFDRFYRIDPERTKDLMSTGLGLAIAKELTEAHGGRISVSSVEGEGTCFTVAIPIAPSK